MTDSEQRADVAGAVVPDAVARLAQQRGFGPLVDVRREVSRGSALLRGGATAVFSAVALVFAGWLGKDLSIFSWTYSLVRFVGLFFFFTCFAGIVYAIRGLVVGSRAHYLFAGGLVTARRGGPRAVAWPDLEALETVYNRRTQGQEGRVVGYRVRGVDGTAFVVPLLLADGRDAFIDRVIEQARGHGRPIR